MILLLMSVLCAGAQSYSDRPLWATIGVLSAHQCYAALKSIDPYADTPRLMKVASITSSLFWAACMGCICYGSFRRCFHKNQDKNCAPSVCKEHTFEIHSAPLC